MDHRLPLRPFLAHLPCTRLLQTDGVEHKPIFRADYASDVSE